MRFQLRRADGTGIPEPEIPFRGLRSHAPLRETVPYLYSKMPPRLKGYVAESDT
ncbi:hypothetical protein ACUXQ2_000293 [Cupriavidus metallidurans]